jgi:hypothetical protein
MSACRSPRRFKTIGPQTARGRQYVRVIVTGDREWTDVEKIDRTFDVLAVCLQAADTNTDVIVVQGVCRGADWLSREAAQRRGWPIEDYPADWDRHGRAAGPIRNSEMLRQSLHNATQDGYIVKAGIAFHSHPDLSKGTKDMVSKLKRAGIPVLNIR